MNGLTSLTASEAAELRRGNLDGERDYRMAIKARYDEADDHLGRYLDGYIAGYRIASRGRVTTATTLRRLQGCGERHPVEVLHAATTGAWAGN